MAALQNCIVIVILLFSMINLSKVLAEMSSDENKENVDEQRRVYNFDKLRRFLLTADAEQRTARREQQNSFKRELIREYLQAVNDRDSQRFEEVQKRVKTYCNSAGDNNNYYEAACG